MNKEKNQLGTVIKWSICMLVADMTASRTHILLDTGLAPSVHQVLDQVKK